MNGRILVIDPVASSRTCTNLRLIASCYVPMLVERVEDALPAARQEKLGAILIDTPDPVEDLRTLRRDPRLRDIPTIVLSAGTDPSLRITVLKAGAIDYMQKPVDDALLAARLRAILRQNAAADEAGPAPSGLAEDAPAFERPGCVALIGNPSDCVSRLRADLRDHIRDTICVMSREEVLSDSENSPDVYVIDADLGGLGGGLRLMSDLRSRAATRHAHVCIVGHALRPDAAAMAWDLGADEVVTTPLAPDELALRLGTMMQGKRAMDGRRASVAQGLRMAMVDPLTGLHNRRFAMPRLQTMAQADLAILLIDLDRFKSVNDRWGHAAGDVVLSEVAARLAAQLRPGDLVARIGGEEFLIALPDMKLAAALDIAERLCREVAGTPVTIPSGEDLCVTISIGLATRGRMGTEPVMDTVDRADHALLQSKAAGRNQVTVGSAAPEWAARSA
ncbi:diguanylate cyclase [Falsirhodobacter sp. alg1]|uniref:diguanylate cyclase n=1 Tax=Falsirhodobacter sp. alg1 TaxID=1472418 RepID=UPI0005F0824D|nr:diguanylate cyclase [Falsirhodobacter sp. alg1]